MIQASYFECEQSIDYRRKSNEAGHEDDEAYNEEDEDDLKYLRWIRLVLGGLLFPSISIFVDRVFLSSLNITSSTLLRTIIVI